MGFISHKGARTRRGSDFIVLQAVLGVLAPLWLNVLKNKESKMAKKIYVGNISFKTTEDEIKELFAKFGEVESAKLITDPRTGRPKGFGFVEMASEEDAQKAIAGLNGSTYMERTLSVDAAKPQAPRERGGFGGGGGRGGFGGGRGSGRGRG